MSDEQRTSWRDRFFGSAPAQEPTPEVTADDASTHHEVAVDAPLGSRDETMHSAELAPDSAEVAATSVEEHDLHQPLVEHDVDDHGEHRPLVEHHHEAEHADAAAPDSGDQHEGDRSADSPIEPRVIAPSALRGPSHSAAHPDDTARVDLRGTQGDAGSSSLERADEASGASAADTAAATDTGGGASRADAPTEAIATEPPALVEPRRPSFGLRRQSDASADAHAGADVDAAADATSTGAGAGLPLAGLAAASAMGAAPSHRDTREEREYVEPEPTQAIDQQRSDDTTQAIDQQRQDDATRPIDTDATSGDTRVMDAQDPAAETRPQRFGIVRDDARASSTIPVDDETASATAAGGTPIVLVEEPVPPRRKGARAVGFAVALLATLIFAILFAAAFFAVGYLFDRAFDATETLQSVWLRPSYLLPVIVFFLAYWILTLIVNRAGWWAHVLGAFLVALLVYAAHIGGAYMEAQGGWAGYTALPGIDARALSQLLLAPLSVLAFVIAREVPVWVGGIVARRGRKAREWNRQATDDFNAENADRLAAYERARS